MDPLSTYKPVQSPQEDTPLDALVMCPDKKASHELLIDSLGQDSFIHHLSPFRACQTVQLLEQNDPQTVVVALCVAEIVGARDNRLYRPYNQLFGEDGLSLSDNIILYIAERERPFQAELTARHGSYRFFPASVISHSQLFGRITEDRAKDAQLFYLRLPDEAHETVLRHCAPGPHPIALEGFGYLRYTVNPGGSVTILEIENELYDRLTCDDLRAQYQDWASELLDAFIQYVETSTTLQPSDEDCVASHENDYRTIIIPPLSVISERYGQYQLPEEAPWAQKSDEHGWFQPGKDPRLLIERYQSVPSKFGFQTQTFDHAHHLAERDSYTFSEGLTLTVESPAHLRITPNNPLLDQLFRDYQRLADPTYALLIHQGIGLPRAVPVERLCDSLLALSAQFEVCPALELLPNVKSLSRFTRDLYHQNMSPHEEHKEVLDRVLPSHLTLFGRGLNGGMHDDWTALPDESLPPGLYCYATQSPLQNRHPSLRLVSVDEAGVQRRYVFGIKGGGIAELADQNVYAAEDGSRAPIYRSTGEGSPPSLVSTHQWWGGLSFDSAQVECRRSIFLADHLTQAEPRLVSRVAYPLRLSIPIMFPTWKDAETRWHLPDEYASEVLNATGKPAFSTLVTTLQSDVRVHTLVDRVFNGTANTGSNVFRRLADISQVMRFLYYEHGCSFIPPEDGYFPPNGMLTTPAICEYLRQIGELNHENAEKIYQTVCTDTLAIIRSVHQRGGHLGGGSIKLTKDVSVGALNGGVPTMRNVDIRGGLHDIDSACFFPWDLEVSNKSDVLHLHSSLHTMQIFDLLYWAEMDQWMRLVLFGAPYDPDGHVLMGDIYPEHDLMLYSADPATGRIIDAATLLHSPNSPDLALDVLLGVRTLA